MGRPSGPTVGSSSSDVNSGSSSLTGTSSGTSAVRAPPLGRTIVRLISGIAFPPILDVQMGHLAVASDIPTVFMMQRVTDLTFDNAAGIFAFHRFKTVRAPMLFMDCEVNGGSAMQTGLAERLGAAAHRSDCGSRPSNEGASRFLALHPGSGTRSGRNRDILCRATRRHCVASGPRAGWAPHAP